MQPLDELTSKQVNVLRTYMASLALVDKQKLNIYASWRCIPLRS